MKKQYLTQKERSQFSLSQNEKDILVGLLIGDIYAQKRTTNSNPLFRFEQGIIHKDYLYHLFELFNSYCPNNPKIINRAPDKRTGNIYSSIYLSTYSLPCFNELYNLFYHDGRKIVPLNIGVLVTPLAFCYWLCDDGSFCKTTSRIIICTDSFTLDEVTLLADILNDKFNLECYVNKYGKYFRIRIPKRSLSKVQVLLKDIMPPMMLYKIGL